MPDPSPKGSSHPTALLKAHSRQGPRQPSNTQHGSNSLKGVVHVFTPPVVPDAEGNNGIAGDEQQQ